MIKHPQPIDLWTIKAQKSLRISKHHQNFPFPVSKNVIKIHSKLCIVFLVRQINVTTLVEVKIRKWTLPVISFEKWTWYCWWKQWNKMWRETTVEKNRCILMIRMFKKKQQEVLIWSCSLTNWAISIVIEWAQLWYRVRKKPASVKEGTWSRATDEGRLSLRGTEMLLMPHIHIKIRASGVFWHLEKVILIVMVTIIKLQPHQFPGFSQIHLQSNSLVYASDLFSLHKSLLILSQVIFNPLVGWIWVINLIWRMQRCWNAHSSLSLSWYTKTSINLNMNMTWWDMNWMNRGNVSGSFSVRAHFSVTFKSPSVNDIPICLHLALQPLFFLHWGNWFSLTVVWWFTLHHLFLLSSLLLTQTSYLSRSFFSIFFST